MMLAVTPGLFGAELIAEAMPASVLLVESMVIEVEAPPTAMVSVPVPTTAAALDTGCRGQPCRGRQIVHLQGVLAGNRI